MTNVNKTLRFLHENDIASWEIVLEGGATCEDVPPFVDFALSVQNDLRITEGVRRRSLASKKSKSRKVKWSDGNK